MICSIYVILLTHILVIFYTFEQTRNKLNINNFLKYYSLVSLVSNVPKYIKDHLKENCVNVNFDILSKKDAYLERVVHNKNVRFVYKDLVNAIISLPTEKNFQMGKTS